MFSRSIPILLIAALLGCPLCCQAKWHPPAVERTAGPSADRPLVATADCCHVCHDRQQQPPSPRGDDAPCPCGGSGPSGCQCICGGAVLASPPDVDFALLPTAGKWLAVPASADACDFSIRCSPADTLPHQGRATPGRAICVLHMTLLC